MVFSCNKPVRFSDSPYQVEYFNQATVFQKRTEAWEAAENAKLRFVEVKEFYDFSEW